MARSAPRNSPRPNETTRLLLELREELRQGRSEALPARTLAQLAVGFLAVKRRTIASADDFEARLRNHLLPALGGRTWRTLKKRDAHSFLLDLVHRKGLSLQTANHVRDVARQLIEDAIDNEEWPAANPFARVDPFRVPVVDKDVLTRAEAGALLWAVPPRWRPIFALALYLGPRRKTIYSMCLEDVDFANGLLDFNDTKTGRKLTRVPIPKELEPHLRKAVRSSPGPWLFVNRFGNRHSRDSRALNRVLRAALRKAGIIRKDGNPPRLTFRGLRRVCSCLLQEAGVNPWVVSRVLGHSQASLAVMGNPVENTTAKRYTFFSPGFVRRQLDLLHLRKR